MKVRHKRQKSGRSMGCVGVYAKVNENPDQGDIMSGFSLIIRGVDVTAVSLREK